MGHEPRTVRDENATVLHPLGERRCALNRWPGTGSAPRFHPQHRNRAAGTFCVEETCVWQGRAFTYRRIASVIERGAAEHWRRLLLRWKRWVPPLTELGGPLAVVTRYQFWAAIAFTRDARNADTHALMKALVMHHRRRLCDCPNVAASPPWWCMLKETRRGGHFMNCPGSCFCC